jgi:hypothetical protein
MHVYLHILRAQAKFRKKLYFLACAKIQKNVSLKGLVWYQILLFLYRPHKTSIFLETTSCAPKIWRCTQYIFIKKISIFKYIKMHFKWRHMHMREKKPCPNHSTFFWIERKGVFFRGGWRKGVGGCPIRRLQRRLPIDTWDILRWASPNRMRFYFLFSTNLKSV